MSQPQANERAIEDWFVGRAVPRLIRDYSATHDVFTRAFSFLGLVLVLQLLLAFTPDAKGWNQALWFLLGVGLLTGALVAVNRFRGRAPLARPDHVGILELAVFALLPPFLRALSTGDASDFPLWTGINIGILILTYAITSFGLLPMIPWALRQMSRQLSGILNLFAKSLPLLLLFSAFLFVNAEIWQVATDIPGSFYVIVLVMLVLVGSLFIALALRHTMDDLNEFDSWEQVAALSADTPVDCYPTPDRPLTVQPLSRWQRLNLGLLMFVSQAIQVLLVALMIAGFYIAFGLLTVRETTILQWTTSDEVVSWGRFNLLGDEMILSKPLVLVAGFIAAFSGLQFAVSIVTDETYRREFADDIRAEVRQSLAARCRYLAAEAPEADASTEGPNPAR